MICGVLSCGSVRSTRRTVALLIVIPDTDKCFILHLLQSLSIATFDDGRSADFEKEIGLCAMLQCDIETWPRSAMWALVSLLLSLRRSKKLRFNDYVLMILLWTWRFFSRFNFRTNHLRRVASSLNRSGWLIWWLCKASLWLFLSPHFVWHYSWFPDNQDHRPVW